MKAFFAKLFGSLHWNAPPWCVFLQQKARLRPKFFWGSVLALVAIGVAWYWVQHLPKPPAVIAKVSAPKPTPIAETLTPKPLKILFGIQKTEFKPQAVAPLDQIGKVVSKGVTMSPQMPGTWVWESDSRLVFTPEKDWPADQPYQITFSKDFFAAGTNVSSYQSSFSTAPFQASIKALKWYQDPLDAKVHQVVATVAFNFPVDPKSLETKASLVVNKTTYPLSVSFDEHKRVAYLRSASLPIAKAAQYAVLTLDAGLNALDNGAKTKQASSSSLLIPDVRSYFKVTGLVAQVIRDPNDRPEQVLNLETSLGLDGSALNKHLHVYRLPTNKPQTTAEAEVQNYAWQNPGEVTPAILAEASPIALKAIPSGLAHASLHSYHFEATSPGYLYVKIDKGLRGFGDFALSEDYQAIVKVPEFPKEISFLHKGALLALGSEEKLSVMIRGLKAVKFQISRVLPNNVNQLVTQAEGDFNNPYFINRSFDEANISEIFSELRTFDPQQTKLQYTALDFASLLKSTSNLDGPKGLFLVQGTAWDPTNNTPLDTRAKRLILVTDMGLLVKDNNDETHDVFVQSIVQGQPIPKVQVSVLGKNGLALFTETSDDQGQVHFPSLKDFVDDREPVVYLASNGADVSFIPYNKFNRQLEFSRFDVGGLYNSPVLGSLSAFVFTDRGLYRPGDTAHLGLIVKQAWAKTAPKGLPLQVSISDPRGTTLLDKQFSLDESGFFSFDFKTAEAAPTGSYSVTLYTVRDNRPENYLGSSSFRVAEFQPDRLHLVSQFLPKPSQGWLSPTGLKAKLRLTNLYGAPAVNHKVAGKIILRPQVFQFDAYPDYIFSDPLLDPKKTPRVFTEDLSPLHTDEQGEAIFNLNVDKFDKGSYQLSFYGEGFESEAGRSVMSETTTMVSPLSVLIGYKPDGDLGYIAQHANRSLRFIAIDQSLKQQALGGLKIELSSQQPVTSLVKKEDGTYQYQSVMQSKIISTTDFSIAAEGLTYPIPSGEIGNFTLRVFDDKNQDLAKLSFSVVGLSQTPLAKNAELQVTLNKAEYQAGETIELQISAPYTGAGLITIERDKVVASQWFKTDMVNSVQRIRIPDNFQGNGYVNLAFVRDWSSPDIFISPLSYAVIPFSINKSQQDLGLKLTSPKEARPGEALTIQYQSEKPGKIIVYAVDEGILQVARYRNPDPLSFFFQKRALEVATKQTLDQILPAYNVNRELSSVGGDGGEDLLAAQLNPFKRKSEAPVVFWSGLIDTDTNVRDLVYQVPNYFNGRLRIMAVAAGENAVGSAQTQAEIRGPFVINPNAPNVVAPGDEFEVSVSVANNVKGSTLPTQISLSVSPGLQLLSKANQEVAIQQGQEANLSFKLRARDELGSQSLQFKVSQGSESTTREVSLSLRPAAVYQTSLTAGETSAKTTTLPLTRSLYPYYRKVSAAASTSPLILVSGLQRYLDNFPYGCTEQLVSKAFPLLAMTHRPEFSQASLQLADKLQQTLQMLSLRQMSSGGFAYWPNAYDNESNQFASIYAMHFLTEARAQHLPVPNDLFYAGIAYLKDLVSHQATGFDNARLLAYATYILTRNEIVTSAYLLNLKDYLDKNFPKVWQKDITGVYLAASLSLLKNEPEALALIKQYQPQARLEEANDFYDSNTADAQYLYVLANHFPALLSSKGDALLSPLVAAMNAGEMNTILASYISLALAAFDAHTTAPLPNSSLSLSELLADHNEKMLAQAQEAYVSAALDPNATALRLSNPEKQKVFYQLTEAGFDKTNDKRTSVAEGMEIFREYRDSKGQVVQEASLGSEIEVRILARAKGDHYLSNIAIIDLLPGGFEVVSDSVTLDKVAYADVREDRVVFFTSLDKEFTELKFRIKAISRGRFGIPSIFAGSMYDPKVKATAVGQGVFTIE